MSEKKVLDLSERIKTYNKIMEYFNGFGTLNWERIEKQLRSISLNEKEKQTLTTAFLRYIERAVHCGQFGNLNGLVRVMNFFSINEISLTEKWVKKILKHLNRFPAAFLHSMCPGLRNGKLRDGRKYEEVKNEYVRELLEVEGASEEELTDEFIEELWNVYEILMHIHAFNLSEKFKNKKITTMNQFIRELA